MDIFERWAGDGAPNGIRTRVYALKGRRPRPLDDGDIKSIPILML